MLIEGVVLLTAPKCAIVSCSFRHRGLSFQLFEVQEHSTYLMTFSCKRNTRDRIWFGTTPCRNWFKTVCIVHSQRPGTYYKGSRKCSHDGNTPSTEGTSEILLAVWVLNHVPIKGDRLKPCIDIADCSCRGVGWFDTSTSVPLSCVYFSHIPSPVSTMLSKGTNAPGKGVDT